MCIILFGHKSTGKTFYGNLLAKELALFFIDTDRLIEKLYTSKTNQKKNCRQIALEIGETGFRALEETIIEQLSVRETSSNKVIAVGGGTVLNPKNCVKLQTLGKLVYLETDRETLKSRMFRRGVPSFLDPKNLEQSFEKMYVERKFIYEKIAAFKVELPGKKDKEILDELIQIWAKC